MPEQSRRSLPVADGEPLVEFIALMARMRAECAWKAGQTHGSLARFLLEEAHETLEAIDSGDPVHLREELGDLLLQVYFHSEIAREAGEFTIDDVVAGLSEKMIRRNPHIFTDGGDRPTDPAAIDELWQQMKAEEKRRTSVFDGIPPTLPALLLAYKVLERLERAGTPAESATSSASAQGDGAEDEIGRRLLGVVEDARRAGVDPERALRTVVRRLG
ncbi:XTP/dITP diphosphohydrolase [Nocardioides daedukensis]|uniref:XTP/dITP diphosphohydrolase n=1 Tax=Nocardioides daedukensis TaxID=634462 RepID=A0A7Y9RYB2_9ACTN|nr:MazG family protein [Nocardioides daedukensis]NYG58495.1 XTP/dITP diphosphohydrolase [Nocardioides daedukensis]